MLNLKNTTLLFVETRAHEITKRVIDDSLSKADFGDVLIFSDKPDLIPIPGARHVPCIDFPNKKDAGAFYYSAAMREVNTDFALMYEWDAGIHDPSKWLPEFFAYDYIGAPWITARGIDEVGNGGFTLMSKKLGHFICDNVEQYPVYTDMDVCRGTCRRAYDAAGFKWPDAKLASFFSWELGPRNPEHFGFHGAFNWPDLLPKVEVVERIRIMLKSPYLTLKLRDVFKNAPWLMDELTTEEITGYLEKVPPGSQLRPRIPGMMSNQQRQALLLMQARRRAPQPVSHLNGTGLKA